MSSVIRVTGAWMQLLADWLDAEKLQAVDIRAVLSSRADDDIIPAAVWGDLVERAAALRPHLLAPGLAIGALVQPRHVGVLGYIVLACNNLGEALLAYQRYERLFYGVDVVQVHIEGEEIELRWPRQSAVLGHIANSLAIAALITFLRRQLDTPTAPSLISFVHPLPISDKDDNKVRAAYEDFFACPVRFDDSHTRVRVPLSYLAIPMPHSDPGLHALLDRQAQALLLALPDSDVFDRSLQQLLLKLLPDGHVALPRVARELHVSVRTLQRRLDARNMNWQALIDRTREQLARQYLNDSSLTLGDIALLLGFSEQSAFNRAFRRWTGETPARLRKSFR